MEEEKNIYTKNEISPFMGLFHLSRGQRIFHSALMLLVISAGFGYSVSLKVPSGIELTNEMLDENTNIFFLVVFFFLPYELLMSALTSKSESPLKRTFYRILFLLPLTIVYSSLIMRFSLYFINM